MMLQEHRAPACSQGQSEGEHKLQDKVESDAKIASSKRSQVWESISCPDGEP